MTANPPLPDELQVEVTGACNLRCRMCLVRYRPPLGRVSGSLPLATFEALVDALPGLRTLTLQGLGEPLLAPDLMRMIAHAKAHGAEVGFNTNGTLLAPAAADRLVALGLDWLHVSLDGASAATHEGIRDGADFAAVVENLRAVAARLRTGGAARPRLAVVFVAMRRNVHELPALVRLAADCGVRRVWVQNLSHEFTDTAEDAAYAEIRRFTDAEALWQGDMSAAGRHFAEAAAVAESLAVDLRLPKLESRARRAAGTPGCDWPWRSAYVRHDGKVQPCCMLMGESRAILGDLAETPFAEIWHGPAYAEFRARLTSDDPPSVCRGCAMYRGVF